MSEHIHKSHNVSKLMYHFVLPAKYRRVVIDEKVDTVIKETCVEIAKRYPINFLEIGTDKDHVHFLVQSEPTYSPSQIVRIIKSSPKLPFLIAYTKNQSLNRDCNPSYWRS